MASTVRRWCAASGLRWFLTAAAVVLALYGAGAPLPAPPESRFPVGHTLPVFLTSERIIIAEMMPSPRWLPLMGVTLHLSADAWPGGSSAADNVLLPRFHRDRPVSGSGGGYRLYLPLYPIVIVMAALAGYQQGKARLAGFKGPNMCRKCGYPLASAIAADGNVREVNCPECGTRNLRRAMGSVGS